MQNVTFLVHGMHAEFSFSADGIDILLPQKIIVPGHVSFFSL